MAWAGHMSMTSFLLAFVAVLVIGLPPALGYEHRLEVRDRDWHHANYWEDAQKLLVKGSFLLQHHAKAPIRVTCVFRLRLEAVDGEGVRHVRKRMPTTWVGQPRPKTWKAVMADRGGRWRMGRGVNSVKILACDYVDA